jgi:acyl transferase domain-containing protein/acyl carrier protein
VGLSCRFPGAETAESFWRNLRDGVDSISEIPPDRWDIDAYYDPDPEAPGKMYSRRAGFVRNLDCFDARFFSISPREALTLDPQQRLLLEVAWEALENAAVPAHQLARTRTGVFVGITGSDFSHLSARAADIRLIDPYSGTGSAACVAPGRLSYILGLQGPSLAVDTACSSSLVAVHLACQSLRLGECQTALAGGVNAILIPDGSIYFCKVRALSPDGRCKTFDASADGYVRGEGCGVVVLKRLSDALANRDRILAVILGSATNHDGPSGGLTIPNGPAQEAVIRAALANAGVQASEIGYVEAHGTGTRLGDPIELQALSSIYSSCAVGSVKTNIGHLEAAAGIAGLIKTVLALRNQTIPPHLNFAVPNPLIPWDRLQFTIPTKPVDWPERRTAGVSAFGFSGTNAHVIVGQAPAPAPVPHSSRPFHVLTLSARTEQALRDSAARYSAYLVDTTESLAGICYTSNIGRTHFAHRIAVAAQSLDELRGVDLLQRAAPGKVPEIVNSYLSGADIDWVAFHNGHACRTVGLPTYPFQRERHWSEALIPQLRSLYTTAWESCSIESGDTEGEEGASWLVLSSDQRIATPLTAALGLRGGILTSTIPENLNAVFRGAVWVASPSETDFVAGCNAVLEVVQRLAQFSTPPRLWLVTQGAQSVGNELRLVHTPLWGLAAVIASEFPSLRCSVVDLDPAADPQAQAAMLVAELHATSAEDLIALRGRQRYVRRLTHLLSNLPGPSVLHSDGTYLITGGLGAIGLQVTERFVESGARNLVLIGRSAPDPDAEERVRRLREKGARIHVVQADVASASDLTRAVEPYRAALRGVIHLAGVLDDGVLLDQTPARFAAVMAPKAAGAWNLHAATLDAPLDFFVLFASAASLLGPPGQGSYAAANAFLDGLAAYRHAQGLAGLSVSWGPWSESGMATATDRRGKARWRARGIRDVVPKYALDLLLRLLGMREPAVAVLPVNWKEFAAELPPGLSPPLLRGLLPKAPPSPPVPNLRGALAEAPPNRRRAVLRDRIQEQCAKVLGIDPSTLDPRQPLAELGLDSLMAVELRNRLGAMAGKSLPTTLLFDYPGVDALTDFLGAELFRTELAAGLALQPLKQLAGVSFIETVEQLSEEQAESMLRLRLETMTRGSTT